MAPHMELAAMSAHGDNPLSAAALTYAAAGIPVFPCYPGMKEPNGSLVPQDHRDRKPVPGSGGLRKASCDPVKIGEWWGIAPNSNIGVPTGELAGVFVIDLDLPKKAKGVPIGQMTPDGAAAWQKLVAEDGGYPPTYEVTTPSGGKHNYFKFDRARPVTNREGALSGLGINVRGTGGYVVGARPDARMAALTRRIDLSTLRLWPKHPTGYTS